MKQIYQILKKIPEEERALYNEKLIDSLYLKFQENEVDDKEAMKKLRKIMNGKDIVVVAPGKSVVDEKEKIHEFLERETEHFIISVNNIPDALFISNQKRFHQIKKMHGLKDLPFPVIITSNIDTGKEIEYVVNYSNLVMSDTMISDNACLMLFHLLIDLGIDEIFVIGFDGYHTNVERNYYAKQLINSSDREKLSKMNKHMKKYMKKIESHLDVHYVTDSMYDPKKEKEN